MIGRIIETISDKLEADRDRRRIYRAFDDLGVLDLFGYHVKRIRHEGDPTAIMAEHEPKFGWPSLITFL